MAKYNLLTKSSKNHSYIIIDFIATSLSESQFKRIQELNMSLLGDYVFVPYKETDYSWWDKVDKYLTKNKLYSRQCFEIDFDGNVTRY